MSSIDWITLAHSGDTKHLHCHRNYCILLKFLLKVQLREFEHSNSVDYWNTGYCFRIVYSFSLLIPSLPSSYSIWPICRTFNVYNSIAYRKDNSIFIKKVFWLLFMAILCFIVDLFDRQWNLFCPTFVYSAFFYLVLFLNLYPIAAFAIAVIIEK